MPPDGSGGTKNQLPDSPFHQRKILTMATKTKTKVNIRPLGDRVLVLRAEAEDKTAGGILLPESAKDKPKEGKIISVGEGRLLDNGERSTFSVKPNNLLF